jgi:ribosomal protein S18 acetylase RimI-like enzyme
MSLPVFQVRRGKYLVSTDPALVEVAELQELLTVLYGPDGLDRGQLLRQLEFSTLIFGLYESKDRGQGPLLAFCRVVSDLTRFAYLADVAVAEDEQGQGLGKMLMEAVAGHPELRNVRVQFLETETAHGLYRKYGFTGIRRPSMWMEKRLPGAPWK